MQLTVGNCENELHKLWKESIHYSGTTSFKVFKHILGQQYALEVRTSVGFVLSGILGSHIKTKNYSKFKPDMNLASKVLENSLKYIKVVENNISDIEKVNLRYARYSIEHLSSTDLTSDDNVRLLELGGWARRYLDAYLASESIARKVLSQEEDNPAAWVLLAASLLDQGDLSGYVEAWDNGDRFGGNREYLQNLRNRYLVLTQEVQAGSLEFISTESPSRKALSKSFVKSEVNAIKDRRSLIEEFKKVSIANLNSDNQNFALQTQLSLRIRDWDEDSLQTSAIRVPDHLKGLFDEYQKSFGHMRVFLYQTDFDVFAQEFEKIRDGGVPIRTYIPIFDSREVQD